MKKTTHIKIFLNVLIWTFLITNISGQSLYVWNGNSGSWNNKENWLVNNVKPTTPPSENDVVLISTEEDIAIALQGEMKIAAMATTGNGNISFKGKKSTLYIANTAILSDNTNVEENVNLSVGNIQASYLPHSFKHSTKSSKKNVNTRSACSFFTIVPNPIAPTCNGAHNGIASVEEPTDGVGPYMYQWVGGPQTRQWSNVGAGTFTIIIIDLGQGTSCSIDVFLNEPGPLTVFAMNGTPPLCANACDGTAAPIVIGGNGGYTLNWSSGESGITASQLCATFTLNVVDQKGCSFDTTYTYTNSPDPILIDADVTHVDCFGNDNGQIEINITGGTGNYAYQWSGPLGYTSTNKDVSGLTPGEYTLHITDENGCSESANYSVTENPQLSATFNKQDNICGGGSTAEISINPTGGMPPYSFNWSGPNGYISNEQNISNLESGTYEVTITDAANCTYVMQVEIIEPAEIDVGITSQNVLCAGGADGQISASATGGTAPYNYIWSGPNAFSATGPSISNIKAGTYTVTVTDSKSCTSQEIIEITEAEPIVAIFDITEITCYNGNDAAIELQISGGSPNYTTQWTGPNGFNAISQNISNLHPGVYSVKITDNKGCEEIFNTEIENKNPIEITATVTNNICEMSADGSIHPDIIGGQAPFSYVWTGPSGYYSNNDELNNLKNGTYHLTLTDANACQSTASFTITSPASTTATFNVQQASCYGQADGAIEINPSGGAEPYMFIWVGPSGFFSQEQNISNLKGGAYSVQVLDANGCMTFFNVNVNQPPKITATGPVTHVKCYGGADGTISPIVSGGNPGYTYAWTGPNGFTSTQKNITGLKAGTYSLTATDNIGCSQTRDYIVNEPLQISLIPTIQNVTCAGSNDGSIAMTIENGTGPLNYNWSGPNGFTANTKDITNLSGGTYHLTVIDAKGCSSNESFAVDEDIEITVQSQVNQISCFGEEDGKIEVDLQGGGEPYTLSWTGPNGFSSSQNKIENLAAGTYELNILDDNGCALNYPITITEPNQLNATITLNNISCFGNNDGSLTANVSGGTGTYNYSWTGPEGFSSNNQTIANLKAGNYELTVADANGCQKNEVISIEEPDELILDIEMTHPGCVDNNGALTANVTGGVVTTDYIFKWLDENGIEVGYNNVITNLAPGYYEVIVTDDNGCEISAEAHLIRPTLIIDKEINHIDCFDNTTGSIEITVVDGIHPVVYTWNGPNGFYSTDPSIENLAAGLYHLEVEDAAGCMLNLNYEITQPDEIEITATILPETCTGLNDGNILLQISGGIQGYAANWSGPNGFVNSGFNVSDLTPGVYSVEVKDVNGCTKTENFDVPEAQVFDIDITASQPICAGENSGAISVEATPSSSNYNYNWSGPNGYTATGKNIYNLGEGEYTVAITNENGCTQLESTNITMPEPIIIEIEVEGSTCQQQDGSATANVSGGVGALSVSWYDSGNNEIAIGEEITGVASGIYTINVEDENGCVISQSVTISDTSGSVEGEVVNPTCYDGNDGTIEIEVINGTSPFAYDWTHNGTTILGNNIVENLMAGNYTVTVTDANNCVYVASFDVQNPNPIEVVEVITHVSCDPNSGKILLQIQDADNPQVQWTGPNGFSATGVEINQLTIGIYAYEITTDQGCLSSGQVEIETMDELEVTAQLKNVICGSESTGYIDLTVTGGVAPIKYIWSGPYEFESQSQDIADIPAGEYTVTITDATGCFIVQTYTITENEPITAEYQITQPDCNENNGSIVVNLSGGEVSSDYFISWIDSDGNPIDPVVVSTNIGVGIYHFTGSDDNGCAVDTTIILSNPDADISLMTTNLSCKDANDGTIAIDVQGVELPYTIQWVGPNGFTSNDENLTQLEPGQYSYTVIGANSCEYVGTETIDNAPELNVHSQITVACAGTSTGEIKLFVSGVSGPFAYSWVGPDNFVSTNQNISNLISGNYQVEISYGEGCIDSFEFTIGESPQIIIDFITTDILCYGSAAGSIEAIIQGGTPPLTYSWFGPNGFESENLVVENLEAGNYIFSVEDSLGCAQEIEVNIAQPEELQTVETVIAPGCYAAGDGGFIDIHVYGGVAEYSVTWSGPEGFSSQDFSIADLIPGIYEYIVSDNNGCEVSGEIDMPEANPMDLVIWTQDVSCFEKADGGAGLIINGGFEPFHISWEGPNGFTSNDFNIQNLVPGEYSIRVTDAAGCIVGQSIMITQPHILEVAVLEAIDASCSSASDGYIDLQISGGTKPYTYEWNGEDGLLSNDKNIQNLNPGTYFFTVKDDNGCEESLEVVISFILEVSVDAGEDFSICAGDLPLQLSGEGSNVDELRWLDIEGNIIEGNLLEKKSNPGFYQFILFGTNALCSATDTLTIEVIAGPVVDAGMDKEVFSEEVFTLGGQPTSETGVSYLWSPVAMGSFNVNDANPSGYVLESTLFFVEVIDKFGCVGVDSVEVVILPEVKIYSGFSPNDDGVNDRWIIDNIELFPNNVVHIFNRWGQVVYEQKSYHSGNAWDGTYEGKKLPVGTYYYTIDLKDDRFPEKLTGPITIYR